MSWKIKMIWSAKPEELEEKTNNFIKNKVIKDIKYSETERFANLLIIYK